MCCRRMQEELVTSQNEKENMWDRERKKLIEKLKSGQEKMMLCSKVCVTFTKYFDTFSMQNRSNAAHDCVGIIYCPTALMCQ